MVAWVRRWTMYLKIGRLVSDLVDRGESLDAGDALWWLDHMEQQIKLHKQLDKRLALLRTLSERVVVRPNILIVKQEEVDAAVVAYLESKDIREMWEHANGEVERPS